MQKANCRRTSVPMLLITRNFKKTNCLFFRSFLHSTLFTIDLKKSFRLWLKTINSDFKPYSKTLWKSFYFIYTNLNKTNRSPTKFKASILISIASTFRISFDFLQPVTKMFQLTGFSSFIFNLGFPTRIVKKNLTFRLRNVL